MTCYIAERAEAAMFRAKTAFILGAGASWHYGYPTGEDLVRLVAQKAATARDYFHYRWRTRTNIPIRSQFVQSVSDATDYPGMLEQWRTATTKCGEIKDRLDGAAPLVIDYFLGHNKHLEDIGKLLISWVLLEREAVPGNENRREIERGGGFIPESGDNWCRFLIHKLVSGCINSDDLLKNQIAFVTFNYDLSLEKNLIGGLKSLHTFEPAVESFLSGRRIIHIYGNLSDSPQRDVNWSIFNTSRAMMESSTTGGPNVLNFWQEADKLLDVSFAASQGIKIIAPDKMVTTRESEAAKQQINAAECIYILGYGFDPNNNSVLGFPASLRADPRRLDSG